MKNPALLIVCVILAVSPLMRGSVHAWAQTVIQALVALGAVALAVERLRAGRARGTGNGGSRETLSRRGLSLGRLFWYAGVPCAVLGVWSAAWSPHPAQAVQGLIMLAAYLGFFFLAVLSVRTREEERALVWTVVWTASGLAAVGLLERFDVLVFPWWNYAAELKTDHGATRLAGVYVNSNHMAGFLEMAIPVLLALFLIRSRPLEMRLGMIGLALFLAVCQVLTLSRGGWAATAGALAFMAVVLLLNKGFAHKRLVAGLLAGALVTAVIVLASTPVVDRAVTLTQGDIEDSLTGRLTYWEGTRRMIADNLAAGTGPGTFAVAFPPYQVPGLAVLPTYAHNDYLHFTAEAGILFVPLLLWLAFVFFRAGFAKFKSRSRQTAGIAVGCMAAVVAILIHSYSDGNLHIPANALLFTALTALVLKN